MHQTTPRTCSLRHGDPREDNGAHGTREAVDVSNRVKVPQDDDADDIACNGSKEEERRQTAADLGQSVDGKQRDVQANVVDDDRAQNLARVAVREAADAGT